MLARTGWRSMSGSQRVCLDFRRGRGAVLALLAGLNVAAISVDSALAQRRPDAPPANPDDSRFRELELPAGFVDQYVAAGSPRMIFMSHTVYLAGGASKALDESALIDEFGARLQQRFVADPRITVVDVPTSPFRERAEFDTLARNDMYEAARLLGRETRADLVVLVVFTERPNRPAGARYSASYVLADVNRGRRIGVHTFDIKPGVDGFEPGAAGRITSERLQDYARALTRRITEDFTRAYPKDGPIAGGRAYAVRLSGVDAMQVGNVRDSIRALPGVRSVSRGQFEEREGGTLASFDVVWAGEPIELALAASRVASQATQRDVTFKSTREGSIILEAGAPLIPGAPTYTPPATYTPPPAPVSSPQVPIAPPGTPLPPPTQTTPPAPVTTPPPAVTPAPVTPPPQVSQPSLNDPRFLRGDANTGMTAPVQQFQAAYAAAGSPRLAVVISPVLREVWERNYWNIGTPGTGQPGGVDGDRNVTVIVAPRTNVNSAVIENGSDGLLPGESSEQRAVRLWRWEDRQFLALVESENEMIGRLKNLGARVVTLEEPWTSIERDRVFADGKASAVDLARELGRRGNADIVITGVGTVVRDRGTPAGRPRSLRHTYRAIRVADGEILSAITVERPIDEFTREYTARPIGDGLVLWPTWRVDLDALPSLRRSLSADATGRIASNLQQAWGAPRVVTMRVTGVNGIGDVQKFADWIKANTPGVESARVRGYVTGEPASAGANAGDVGLIEVTLRGETDAITRALVSAGGTIADVTSVTPSEMAVKLRGPMP
jgi:hypothetical protein